jgi:hypothetical protein
VVIQSVALHPVLGKLLWHTEELHLVAEAVEDIRAATEQRRERGCPARIHALEIGDHRGR